MFFPRERAQSPFAMNSRQKNERNHPRFCMASEKFAKIYLTAHCYEYCKESQKVSIIFCIWERIFSSFVTNRTIFPK